VVLVVSVVPPEAGNPFHQADDDVVQGSVQVDYVEDCVMAEIMLQPTSLSLVEEKKEIKKEREKRETREGEYMPKARARLHSTN
jgi:hypothetical protein